MRTTKLTLIFTSVLAVLAFGASSASAAESAWWQLLTSARPGVLVPGSTGTIIVRAVNIGDLPVSGAHVPVRIADVLPSNLTAESATAVAGTELGSEIEGYRGRPLCSVENAGSVVGCSWEGVPLEPFEELDVYVKVRVGAEAVGAENAATISGGEPYICAKGGGNFDGPFCGEEEEHAGGYEVQPPSGVHVPGVSLSRPVTVANTATPFGLSDFNLALENEGGSPDTQAGSHPFQFTTTVAFNESASLFVPPAFAKDVNVNLPPGLVGDVQNIPRCTEAEFAETQDSNDANACPNDTAVGVAAVTIDVNIGSGRGPTDMSVPVFNLVPSPGEPARFGFEVVKAAALIDTSVRTGSDYGITAHVTNITQFVVFRSSTIALWGVPGAAAHRLSRGWSCVRGGEFYGDTGGRIAQCPATGEAQPQQLFTAPTSCNGPLSASAQVDSWPEPNTELSYEPGEFGHQMQSMDGCAGLPFAASIEVAPGVQEASRPSGLNVHIHVPQEASVNPTGIAGADVKSTTVTLPEGVTLNPAGADGLEACDDTQIGYKPGQTGPAGELQFSPSLPEPLNPGTGLGALGFCPNASKVGKVEIKTPLLEHELEGSVYLAAQNENPFGSLVAMYIVAEDPVSGVLVKLPGEVSLNPSTGQITSTFANTPQVPFEDLELEFFGGDRAPLSTPPLCRRPGEPGYQTVATFTPWSGTPPVTSTSEFHITSGPGGGACPNPQGNQSLTTLPFAPSLTAGMLSGQAGGFSALTTTIGREDGQQNIQQVTLHMPPGLSGVLSGVKLCPEAQANAGTCGAESLIGHTIVSVGLGSNPYSVTGGEVFLTEKYGGGQFGLSIVNPAVAGPFNLGKVIVRASIAVDPHTAALTITTDNSGPYKIPTILDGIPLQIKHINVTIDRNHFTFNSTDCNPQQVTGNVASAEGASSPVSVPFQVTNCAALKFQPKFASSTAGRTTRSKGASLSVKLTYPSTPQGTEANIARVKVDLPKQLPSRLTTLQKACLAKVFEANPANCPSASVVGHAKAITPILPVPLEGPAYFVSHGGEAFPSLIVVLQGYGVTVDLVGTTFISHAGITSSTFKTVPDVPVGSFELNLPEGKYSALAANLPAKAHASFCGQKLAMPTAFVAQNGQEIHESTAIGVSGCPKAAKKSSKKKHKGKKKPAKANRKGK